MTEYNPHGDYLLLEPEPQSETAGEAKLIIIPEGFKTTINAGTILKCGPAAGQFTPGDKVIFRQNAEWKFKLDGESVLVVSAAEVMLVKPCKVAKSSELDAQLPPIPFGN